MLAFHRENRQTSVHVMYKRKHLTLLTVLFVAAGGHRALLTSLHPDVVAVRWFDESQLCARAGVPLQPAVTVVSLERLAVAVLATLHFAGGQVRFEITDVMSATVALPHTVVWKASKICAQSV